MSSYEPYMPPSDLEYNEFVGEIRPLTALGCVEMHFRCTTITVVSARDRAALIPAASWSVVSAVTAAVPIDRAFDAKSTGTTSPSGSSPESPRNRRSFPVVNPALPNP